MNTTNPYDAPAIPATPSPRKSRPFLTGCVTAAFVLSVAASSITSYYVGYWHGYKDTERMLGDKIKREMRP